MFNELLNNSQSLNFQNLICSAFQHPNLDFDNYIDITVLTGEVKLGKSMCTGTDVTPVSLNKFC